MSIDLKKRFDRIVDILIQLQSKRIVKAQDLANRFEVSLRTIYRDIKSLEQAGVPIIGEAGTGYSIVDGYKLPPIIFTKEEALSFIGAEKLMERYMDEHLVSNYKSAIYKIKSVLKHSDQDMVSTLENQIQLSSPSYDFFNREVPQALSLFFKSIASKKQVNIQYKGVQDLEAHNRIIEPIGLYHGNNFWYIAAFCMLRNNYRLFRADRIISIELSDTNFKEDRMSLKEFIHQQSQEKEKIEIRISTSTQLAPQFHWERLHFGYKDEIINQDCIEMRFEYSGNTEHFVRWFLMFADESEILTPISLRDRAKEILMKSLSRMNKHK